MSRRHQPGRRTRRKRPEPEVIVLARRSQPPQGAPKPDDDTVGAQSPEHHRDRRGEVLADIREEARRWR